MTHVGIDLEQFVVDPYGSGIQRVLQYLAIEWPDDLATAEFVVPHRDEFLLLTPDQAAELVGTAFALDGTQDIRSAVAECVQVHAESAPRLRQGALLSCFGAWLLPEVSYLPSVLDRFALFSTSMPTAMIGYDALPMTDPANYRFPAKSDLQVSRYFRILANCDAVVCISDYSRSAIIDRLRRPQHLITRVAHPGGDHVLANLERGASPQTAMHFLRLGTLEARKMPVEIAEGFARARREGIAANLTFIGKPSASDQAINRTIRDLADAGIGLTWITDASDTDVRHYLNRADFFLSFGVEGFGIPVLESLRVGVPTLFGGIQPAAELMDGRGATRVSIESVDHVADVFKAFAQRDVAEQAREAIDIDAIPSWRDFAVGVVTTVLEAT